MHPTDEGQQERILRTLTTLYTLRPNWGGALIVAIRLNPQGAALAFASNIAGGVCLSLEDDPVRIKEAIRTGACDFVVNTLDEALRTIKNEIRKHLPLSVGLQAPPALILHELVERGVAPCVFTDLSSKPVSSEAASRFESLGARVLDFEATAETQTAVPVQIQLEAFLRQQNWRLHAFTFETYPALRDFDARALALLPEHDQVRRSWIRAAPRILQRERPLRRLLWLTGDEERTLQSER